MVDTSSGVAFFMQAIDVLQLDSIVNFVPDPAQKTLNNPYGWIGNVRRNFVRIFAGFLRRSFPLDPAVSRFSFNYRTNVWIVKHIVQKRSSVGQIRPDSRRPALAKVNPENS